MKQRSLRAEDVASTGGCSYTVFIQWLAGKSVTDDTFAKFAKGLGLSVEELKKLDDVGAQATG